MMFRVVLVPLHPVSWSFTLQCLLILLSFYLCLLIVWTVFRVVLVFLYPVSWSFTLRCLFALLSFYLCLPLSCVHGVPCGIGAFSTQSVDYAHILCLCLLALLFIMCASNVPCGIGVLRVHPVSWLDSHPCCDYLVLHVDPLFLKINTLLHLHSPFESSDRKGPIVPWFMIPSVSSDSGSAVVSS